MFLSKRKGVFIVRNDATCCLQRDFEADAENTTGNRLVTTRNDLFRHLLYTPTHHRLMTYNNSEAQFISIHRPHLEPSYFVSTSLPGAELHVALQAC